VDDDAGHGEGSGPQVAADRIVLASGSRYRAELLTAEGIDVDVDPPDIEERALDGRLPDVGPAGLAVELARLKAQAVALRHPGRVILAADQVGVLPDPAGTLLLTKQADEQGAVDQLCAMSGTSHQLVNGVVVIGADAHLHEGIDIQVVTMRRFDEAEARGYVRRFRPFDTSGSYRIEDQEVMEAEAPGSGLVLAVRGEDPSGVVGLPMPLVRRLLRLSGGPSTV